MPVPFIGSLDAVIVRNISLVDVICLKWVDPPSLDITGVDLDFWYHVDVTVVDVTMVDVTMVDVSLSTYHFMKVVNIPEFNFTVADGIDTNISVIYQFEVTPINGAGDGVTSSPVTGFFRRSELLMAYNYFFKLEHNCNVKRCRDKACSYICISYLVCMFFFGMPSLHLINVFIFLF